MKENRESISEEQIQKYVDDQLSIKECRDVEKYLKKNPDETKRVKDYQRINLTLKNLFDSELAKDTQINSLSREPKDFRLFYQAAASVILFLAGLTGGWFINDFSKNDITYNTKLVQRANSAYMVYTPEVRHPVEVDAEESEHMNEWLSKRLGKTISAPDLSSAGYELLGGRLLQAEGQPAALFMYENESGNRLTLYLQGNTKSKKNTALRYKDKNEIKTVYWTDGKLGYAVSGEVTKNELYDIATQVYNNIESI
jgi:anti-sigma factor RsiW